MKKNQIENLKRAVEHLHHCIATHIEEIAIIEKFDQKTVWQGIVHVFRITGHPQTDTCYAWSSPIKGSTKRHYYAVLKIPPINSPEKAVRASIACDYKQNKH